MQGWKKTRIGQHRNCMWDLLECEGVIGIHEEDSLWGEGHGRTEQPEREVQPNGMRALVPCSCCQHYEVVRFPVASNFVCASTLPH